MLATVFSVKNSYLRFFGCSMAARQKAGGYWRATNRTEGGTVSKEPAPKHLTITIDFDLQTEGSTVHYQRARAAYEAAVEAAIREVRKVLPTDSIRGITSEIDWSYRWTRESDVQFRRPDLVDEIEEITDEDEFGN